MRRVVAWMCAVAGILLFLSCMGIALPIEFALYIAFGWIWYLARTIPRVEMTSDGIATAALCLLLIVVGSQFFLNWLYREIRSPANLSAPRNIRWKWRWTGDLLVVIVLMFVAGMAVTGMTHQLGWLLASKDPWVVSGGSVAARRAQSVNNLKQIGLALDSYQEPHHSFPPGGTFDRQGRPLQSWQAMILPYIELQALHERIDFSMPWNDPRNAPVFQTLIPVYLDPGIETAKNAAGFALSHYAANVHMLGGDHHRTFNDVSDGQANTIMAGEVAADFKAWGDPTNWRDPQLGLNQNPAGFASPSPGGVNFLFVDGTVKFIKNSVDPSVLKALSTPAGSEKVYSDQY